MKPEDFQLEVIQRLTRLETLSKSRPACQYSVVDERLKTDRRLILGVLWTYVPMTVFLAFATYELVK